MYNSFRQSLTDELTAINDAHLYKHEKLIATAQSAQITLDDGRCLVNFCANNYLGLANDPRLVAAAQSALDRWGFGLSSVRFICGTQQLHRQLEAAISSFLSTDDTILYSSCFDANGGLFETILNEHDAVISDQLNHASIIDGIRLCKASRFRYQNRDMADLENQLKQTASFRRRLIATDGVFSMDGTIAPLADICELADRYDAVVMVDDSHATGFVGPTGKGTPELHGVTDRVDIVTSTFGKALGGASGGFTSGRKEIIEILRQKSRPYLFSNTLAPAIAAATLTALDIITSSDQLRRRLNDNTAAFRRLMTEAGFTLSPSPHPIVPVILHDEDKTLRAAQHIFEQGFYVVGFTYPVVPRGQARIRVQISAAHTPDQLQQLTQAFISALRT